MLTLQDSTIVQSMLMLGEQYLTYLITSFKDLLTSDMVRDNAIAYLRLMAWSSGYSKNQCWLGVALYVAPDR